MADVLVPGFGVRAAALAVVVFYVATAHLTSGGRADLAVQWLGAHMIATGRGRQLYDHAALAAAATPGAAQPIADGLIPMYPPVQAVLYAPLGFVSPDAAQWIVVQLSVLLAIAAACTAARLGRGTPSRAVATLATLTLPSFFVTIALGQNSAVLLAVMILGWAELVAGRSVRAGAIWSILAFKPTWLVAVLWIPLVVRRARAYPGLVAGTALLALLTLPFCGERTWLDWLAGVRWTHAADATAPHWMALRRDLPAVLHGVAPGAGWIAIAALLGATARLWRAGAYAGALPAVGARPVMLFAAVILSCPRFMTYDATVGAMPFLLALASWPGLDRGGRASLVALIALFWLGTALAIVVWRSDGPPIETVALAGLWGWAAVQVARSGRAQGTVGASTTTSSPSAADRRSGLALNVDHPRARRSPVPFTEIAPS